MCILNSYAEIPFHYYSTLNFSNNIFFYTNIPKKEASDIKFISSFANDRTKKVYQLTITSFELFIIKREDKAKQRCTGPQMKPEIKVVISKNE